jgi:carboxypeptidase family protein
VKLFGTLLLLLALTVSTFGQSANGSLTGTVTDPSGSTVPSVKLTARNLDTGFSVETASSSAGLYSFPNLPTGRYSITAEAPGMKKFQQEGVTVSIGATANLDIALQIGAVSEQVTVVADAAQLETSTSDVGATVQRSLVENLPLEVSGTVRNPVQFITLIPGFVGNVGNDPGSNSTDDFKVNGGQEGSTDILVDGVSISLVSPNTQWNKGVSTEGVQEFKVLQSNFSPEYGESGDGIVSLTLKSGTNSLHGSVYDFYRNRALDANSWVNNTAGQERSVNTQDDFGFTVGGPVFIPHVYHGQNKSFFFVDYEGFRFHSGGTSILSLPPEAFRNGDFSALLPTTQLYDPTTHAAIPGNILSNDPNYMESAVITKLMALLPPTNGALTNNTINRTVNTTTANLFDVKFDQTISNRQRMSFGFDYDNTNTGGVSALGPVFGSKGPQDTRYGRVSDDYVITNSLVNHFLFGFSRRFRGEIADTVGQDYPAKLGLTGVQNFTLPCFIFVGDAYQNTFNNCGDSEFADNVFQYADAVSWVKGKHEFKFGGEARFLQFNVRRLTTASGEFDFNSAETSLNGVGGEPVASALFGLVHQSEYNFGGFSGVRYKNYSLYAQDNFKVLPRLTINYGLRYDLDIPATEAFNRFSAVDPTLPNPGAGGILGAYTYYGTGPGRNGQTRPQDIYTKAFGPRLGFAYSINTKTVLRGGYGIFYEPLREGSFADQDGLGFFNKQTITTTNGAPFQIDNGMPHILPASGPFTPDGQNGNSGVILVPSNTGREADIQSWNLDLQRQITSNLMISVAYVGSKGTHLPALNIIPNQVNPSFLSLGSELQMDSSCLTLGTCPMAIAQGVTIPYAGFTGGLNQALRPYPQYGDFNQEDNSFTPDRTGNSTYHAMQLELNQRMANGLSFLVSYTVSKNLTDADSAGPGVAGFTGTNEFIGQNSYDRAAEKAVSELDTPQSLVASFFYELPVGHGKRFLNSPGAVDKVAGGWYLSGIGTYKSGQPTEVYTSCTGDAASQVLFAGCEFTGAERVDVVPGISQTNKSSSFNAATTPFWNAAAFSIPAPFTFGNEPRSLSSARFFGSRDEDLTLGKKTTFFGERATVDFRAEFFNIFNRHIYMPSVGTPGLAQPFIAAGAPGCSSPFACGFGAISNASGPRTIQFGLKISY